MLLIFFCTLAFSMFGSMLDWWGFDGCNDHNDYDGCNINFLEFLPGLKSSRLRAAQAPLR